MLAPTAASPWPGRLLLVLLGGVCTVVGLVWLTTGATSEPTTSTTRWQRITNAGGAPSRVKQLPLYEGTDDDLGMAYRAHLERTTSLPAQLLHSPTLTFDHIYVLSLPSRPDRRREMDQLARAHGIELTFVDAVNKSEPFIKWIAERAAEVRPQRLEVMVSLVWTRR